MGKEQHDADEDHQRNDVLAHFHSHSNLQAANDNPAVQQKHELSNKKKNNSAVLKN
jgi:hypothetical protein